MYSPDQQRQIPLNPSFLKGDFLWCEIQKQPPPDPLLEKKEGEQSVRANLVFARSIEANPPESPFRKGGLFFVQHIPRAKRK